MINGSMWWKYIVMKYSVILIDMCEKREDWYKVMSIILSLNQLIHMPIFVKMAHM